MLLSQVKQRLQHVISTPSLASMAAAMDSRYGHLDFLDRNLRNEVWRHLEMEACNLEHNNRFTKLISSSLEILRDTFEANKTLLQNVDPLQYWKNETSMLSSLHFVARLLLAIPASSASSERVFSAAGFIHNERRATLTDEHVESMVFIRENFALKDKDDLMREFENFLEKNSL